ncbi:MAG: insulinase family protein [Rhodobacteraceae bacterium]|nr:insulinase family protein [Paracoccaceae bacterium]
MRLCRLVAILCAALLPGVVWPGALWGAGKVTEFTLENGMQAVVIEDHRSPAVVHMVWYRTGAADEPPGLSGIAHFLEHLMFKSTDDLENGAFSRIVEANGGSDNAFTSWDYTAYFQRVAADRLGLMMEMEADRMRDLVITEADVMTERSVVLEERAQRTDSSPEALFNEQLRAAFYLNHPYGIPIIGWQHEIAGLDRADALAFYDRFYAPNNAILIVAGDVTPGDVRRLAQVHYGPIAANPNLPERARPSEPPHIADRVVRYADPRVATPYVTRSYQAAERNTGAQEHAAALVLLARILGGSGTTAVLGRTLQIEEERSLFAGAYYQPLSLDTSEFTLINVPVPGLSLDEAVADLDRVLADFLDAGIDPEQLERIKFQYAAQLIYAQDNVQSLAREYGTALTTGLTVQDVQEWPGIIAATTPGDIMAVARQLFGGERRTVTGYLARPATTGG